MDKIRIFGELKRDVDLLKKNSLELRKDTIDYRAEDLSAESEAVKQEDIKGEEEEVKKWTVTLIDKIESKQEISDERGAVTLEGDSLDADLETGEKEEGVSVKQEKE